jgi:hypothetical protein
MTIESILERIAAALETLAKQSGPAKADPTPAPAAPAASETPPKKAPPKKAAPPAATAVATPTPVAATAPAATAPAQSPPSSAPDANQYPPPDDMNLMNKTAVTVIYLANNYSRDQALGILAKYGAMRVSQVKVEDLERVLAEATAAIETAQATKANESLI